MKRAAFLGGILAGIGVAAFAIPLFGAFAHSFLYRNGIRFSDESIELMLNLMVAGIVLAIAGSVIAWRAKSN